MRGGDPSTGATPAGRRARQTREGIILGIADNPEIGADVLDLAFLREQSFGDVALQEELLDLFEAQCDRLLPIVARTGEPKAAAEAAHTLKGSAAAIGAREVARIAGLLELSAQAEDEEGRRDQLPLLRRSVEAVRDAIGARRAGR